MAPWNMFMGPWYVNSVQCNVIMGPFNLIMGTWNVTRRPWNVNI